MNERAAEIVQTLGLQPHPEGGHYREIYRSALRVERTGGGAGAGVGPGFEFDDFRFVGDLAGHERAFAGVLAEHRALL